MTPLTLTCDEDSRDSITLEVDGKRVSVTVFSDRRNPAGIGVGYTDELLVFLDRAKARHVKDWLSAWLDEDVPDVPNAFNGCDAT